MMETTDVMFLDFMVKISELDTSKLFLRLLRKFQNIYDEPRRIVRLFIFNKRFTKLLLFELISHSNTLETLKKTTVEVSVSNFENF